MVPVFIGDASERGSEETVKTFLDCREEFYDVETAV